MTDIVPILQKLSIDNIGLPGKWVNFSCPLAPFSAAHGYKSDSHPSAGATVSEDGTIYWNCFCCNSKGKLTSLIKILSVKRKKDYSALLDELNAEESYADFDSINYSEQAIKVEPNYIPNYVYDAVFDTLPDKALAYTRGRGILDETLVALNVRYSTVSGRIIFPYYNNNGIIGYSGRSIYPSASRKIINSEFDKSTVIYGQHLWTGKPLVLVEGLFALARAYQVLKDSYDVGALSGTSLSAAQANILIERGTSVTLFLDGDAAGTTGTNIIKENLKNELNLFCVNYTNIFDIDLLTDKDIFDMVKIATVVA